MLDRVLDRMRRGAGLVFYSIAIQILQVSPKMNSDRRQVNDPKLCRKMPALAVWSFTLTQKTSMSWCWLVGAIFAYNPPPEITSVTHVLITSHFRIDDISPI